jgi:hypothetical protein
MKVTVVIPSYAKDESLRKLTQTTIDSLHDSSTINTFRVLIYEQNKNVSYQNAETIYYDYPFIYNKVMNDGISKAKTDWILLSNNDVFYRKNWLEEMQPAIDMGYLSLSPLSEVWHKKHGILRGERLMGGYAVGYYFCGWSLLCHKKVFKTIGKLNEGVNFFFSDNIMAEQLKFHGIKHGLICCSMADHNESTTLRKMDKRVQNELMWSQRKNFEIEKAKIWDKNTTNG